MQAILEFQVGHCRDASVTGVSGREVQNNLGETNIPTVSCAVVYSVTCFLLLHCKAGHSKLLPRHRYHVFRPNMIALCPHSLLLCIHFRHRDIQVVSCQ